MDDHIKYSNNNNTLFHPIIYKKEKFITIVQTTIGALAARNNLRVKNDRHRSGTQEQRKQRNTQIVKKTTSI